MVSRIQQEIKQSRPFRSKTEEAALALLRTADVIRRGISGIVEPHGITMQQYNVLRILRGAGERGLPTLEIAERMIEQTPGITRLVDRLERKHLVVRERCETDRRQVFCRITADGLELLSQLDPRIGAIDEWALLPSRELTSLITLLDKAREGLTQQMNNARRNR